MLTTAQKTLTYVHTEEGNWALQIWFPWNKACRNSVHCQVMDAVHLIRPLCVTDGCRWLVRRLCGLITKCQECLDSSLLWSMHAHTCMHGIAFVCSHRGFHVLNAWHVGVRSVFGNACKLNRGVTHRIQWFSFKCLFWSHDLFFGHCECLPPSAPLKHRQNETLNLWLIQLGDLGELWEIEALFVWDSCQWECGFLGLLILAVRLEDYSLS